MTGVAKLAVALVSAAALALLIGPTPSPGAGGGIVTLKDTGHRAVEPPKLPARAWIMVEARTGERVAGQMTARRLPVASATKLMTAYLALDRLPAARRLTAPAYYANPAESKIGLAAGERMTVRDLLYALILESANDAAVTLAHGVSGSVPRFVAAMNREARSLGLTDTRYANPIGLDAPGNLSSARDLATLTRLLMRNPLFRRIADTPRARLRSGARPRRLVSRNRLLTRVPWITGVKTGHTLGAGYVLVGSGRRHGFDLISVVLGAPSEPAREQATLKLLRHGFRHYRPPPPPRPKPPPAPPEPQSGLFDRVWESVRSPVTLLVLGAILTLIGAARAGRRRKTR